MTELINPIWPGFSYTLDLALDVALTPPGSVLRISLAAAGQTTRPRVDITLSRPAEGIHRISMTKQQTRHFRAPGMAWGDFVLRSANGTERPLNLQIGIPIEQSLTTATP